MDEPKRYRRSAYLSLFRKGAGVFLYHDLTGDILGMDEKLVGFLEYFATPRTAAEAGEAFATTFPPEALEEFMGIFPEHRILVPVEEDERAEIARWFPLHGPWVLTHAPRGGPLTLGYVDRRLDEPVLEALPALEAEVWRACDGARSCRDIAFGLRDEFGRGVDAGVRDILFRWSHSERQLAKLLPRPESAYREGGLPPYVKSTMPYERFAGGERPPEPEVVETRGYHREVIRDADEQFDLRETTLSHALRVPHPALRGERYGACMARVFVERDLLRAGSATSIVETGGGTGSFCAAFLDGLAAAAPALYERATYTVVDLSPALQASQRERTVAHERVRLLTGDAQRLPLPDGSVSLLISNEIIADLDTARVTLEELSSPSAGGPGAEAVRRFDLQVADAPPEFYVNLGAMRFLEEAYRVLAPGGAAVVVEFGEADRYPVESTHLDHREFSIHFGHLRHVAERLGFAARLESVPELLEMDGGVRVLATTRPLFAVLRALLAREGVRLEKVAYTEEMFRELLAGTGLRLEDLGGLDFLPARERLLGLRPSEFKALILRKSGAPGETGRRVELEL